MTHPPIDNTGHCYLCNQPLSIHTVSTKQTIEDRRLVVRATGWDCPTTTDAPSPLPPPPHHPTEPTTLNDTDHAASSDDDTK